jgi:AraC-like DNA-binding protein
LSRQLQLESTSYRKEFERFQIEWAIELIKLNKKAIKQIGGEVGFSDADTFRRAFKRRIGLTILEFRKTLGIVK